MIALGVASVTPRAETSLMRFASLNYGHPAGLAGTVVPVWGFGDGRMVFLGPQNGASWVSRVPYQQFFYTRGRRGKKMDLT